jgi:glyceraldehyde 3-phosphate dehydrogenase
LDQRLLTAPQGLSWPATSFFGIQHLGIPRAGKFDGFAVRVPTPTVSLVDFVVQLERGASVEAINNAFREAAESEDLEGILGISDEELVSSDFIGTSFSSVVDLPLTMSVGDDFFKVVAWYDNEWGYSVRVADLTAFVADGFEE